MKKKLFAVVLAGAVFTMIAMPALSLAGKGRMGSGQMIQTRSGIMTQTQTRSSIMTQTQTQSGEMTQTKTKAGEAQKKGNTYGPGNGEGNQDDRPLDGTGYGATSKK